MQDFHFNSKKFGSRFSTKITHYDVVMIRKSFQAFTKNFSNISEIAFLKKKSNFSSKKINFHFLFLAKTVLHNLKVTNLKKKMNFEPRE